MIEVNCQPQAGRIRVRVDVSKKGLCKCMWDGMVCIPMYIRVYAFVAGLIP